MMSILGVVLANSAHLSGSAWRVTGRNGRIHDQSRYASIRAQQTALPSDKPSAAQLKKLEDLDMLLEQAGVDDEEASASAQSELKSWPKKLQLQSAAFHRPNLIQLRFEGGMAIEFVGGLLGEVSCSVPPLAFVINGDGVRIR